MDERDKPAFPVPPVKQTILGEEVVIMPSSLGLSKRELFAAMMQQALLTAHYSTPEPKVGQPAGADVIAQVSVQHAKALLAELSKPSAPEAS